MADERPRVCAAKLGEPYRMYECGSPVRFLTAEGAVGEGVGRYSGWYHTDPTEDRSHLAVPKHEL